MYDVHIQCKVKMLKNQTLCIYVGIIFVEALETEQDKYLKNQVET